MKLVKANPITESMSPEINRIFDRFFGPRLTGLDTPIFETAWAPSLDFSETDTEYLLRIEAPGMEKDAFDVSLEGNVVTVSGRRELTKDMENEELIWHEREEGKFVRSIRLPKAVQPTKVSAEYANGVLTVHLPKAEQTQKSKIVVK